MKTLKLARHSFFFCLALLLGLGQLQAQDKPLKVDGTKHHYAVKMKSSYIGLGGLLIKDEYLSPLNYGGTSISFMSESNRFAYLPKRKSALENFPFFSALPFSFEINPKFLSQNLYSFDLGSSQNPAGNGAMYMFAFRWDRSLMYRLMKNKFWQAHLGLGVKADFSMLYNTRNGNNPVNLDTSLALTAHLHYAYRLPWRFCPMLFRLSSTTDLLGFRHAMDYGESYYHAYGESFNLGKHLAFASLGNQFVEQLRLSLDLPILNRYILTLAYRARLNNFDYNSRQRNYLNNSFLLGITRYILPLSQRESIEENPESVCF